ncbi:MAG: 50S ribosomal protein L9 [Patescibacteria group bacterium]
MKIILLSDAKNLGRKGELKDVAEGYAMNFLLPKKLAEIATPEAIQRLKKEQETIQQKNKNEEERLMKAAFNIQNKKIIIKAKAEKGKLFGSITTKDIANEIKNQDFEISEKNIILKEPIKSIGERKITIDFGKNIKTEVALDIQEK